MSERRRRYNPGRVIQGTPYEVVRFVGSGAMGAVYEVEHRELNKRLVMKILHDDLADIEDSVRRIKCESRLLARLEHPNIVRVTDAGVTISGVPFFVMERLEGETLAARMRRQATWDVSEVVQLALGVLDGLCAAHELGIVHRDIKPSNIFLTGDSGIKILDFGIAKFPDIDAAATAKGTTLGTPRYMAPEQAMGGNVDCRSDLYALGIIMYELLTGSHPFAHVASPVEMLIAQAACEIPPLELDCENFPTLGSIVSDLVSKDPGGRPRSAKSVRGVLIANKFGAPSDLLVTSSPTRALAETQLRSCRSKKWFTRSTWLFAATVVILRFALPEISARVRALRSSVSEDAYLRNPPAVVRMEVGGPAQTAIPTATREVQSARNENMTQGKDGSSPSTCAAINTETRHHMSHRPAHRPNVVSTERPVEIGNLTRR